MRDKQIINHSVSDLKKYVETNTKASDDTSRKLGNVFKTDNAKVPKNNNSVVKKKKAKDVIVVVANKYYPTPAPTMKYRKPMIKPTISSQHHYANNPVPSSIEKPDFVEYMIPVEPVTSKITTYRTQNKPAPVSVYREPLSYPVTGMSNEKQEYKVIPVEAADSSKIISEYNTKTDPTLIVYIDEHKVVSSSDTTTTAAKNENFEYRIPTPALAITKYNTQSNNKPSPIVLYREPLLPYHHGGSSFEKPSALPNEYRVPVVEASITEYHNTVTKSSFDSDIQPLMSHNVPEKYAESSISKTAKSEKGTKSNIDLVQIKSNTASQLGKSSKSPKSVKSDNNNDYNIQSEEWTVVNSETTGVSSDDIIIMSDTIASTQHYPAGKSKSGKKSGSISNESLSSISSTITSTQHYPAGKSKSGKKSGSISNESLSSISSTSSGSTSSKSGKKGSSKKQSKGKDSKGKDGKGNPSSNPNIIDTNEDYHHSSKGSSSSSSADYLLIDFPTFNSSPSSSSTSDIITTIPSIIIENNNNNTNSSSIAIGNNNTISPTTTTITSNSNNANVVVSCDDNNNSTTTSHDTNDTKGLEAEFIYELLYNNSNSTAFPNILSNVENNILYGISPMLLQCDQHNTNVSNRKLQSSGDTDNGIISISQDPIDTVMGQCEYLAVDEDGTSCFKIYGKMKVYYYEKENDQEMRQTQVEEEISFLIRQGMTGGAYEDKQKGIIGLYYIGSSGPQQDVLPDVVVESNGSTNNNMVALSGAGISMIIITGLFTIAIVVLAVIKRRRYQEMHQISEKNQFLNLDEVGSYCDISINRPDDNTCDQSTALSSVHDEFIVPVQVATNYSSSSTEQLHQPHPHKVLDLKLISTASSMMIQQQAADELRNNNEKVTNDINDNNNNTDQQPSLFYSVNHNESVNHDKNVNEYETQIYGNNMRRQIVQQQQQQHQQQQPYDEQLQQDVHKCTSATCEASCNALNKKIPLVRTYQSNDTVEL